MFDFHTLIPKPYRLNPASGFSYVEFLIIIVLIVITSLGSVMSLIEFYRAQEPRLAAKSIASVLRDAQERAVVQEAGAYWGVKFDAFPGRDRYALFSAVGAGLEGYATSSARYLSSIANMTEPAVSRTVLFEKRTGALISAACPSPAASTTITVGGKSVRIYCDGRVE